MPGSSPAPQWGRAAAGPSRESSGLWRCFTGALTHGYANFRGRARRKEFWAFALFWTLLTIGLSAVCLAADALAGNLDGADPAAFLTVGGMAVALLATLLPSLAVTVRRIHDVGLPGWAILVAFIPGFGGLALLILVLCPSQKETNAWGPVPIGP